MVMLKRIEFGGERVLGRLRWTVGGAERRRLQAASDKLATAIGKALRSQVRPDEAALFTRIETLRDALMRSDEPLEHLDFGAGTPDAALTAETMAAGQKRSRTVKDMSGASKSPFWAGVLFRLVRDFQCMKALELGTCLGVSAAYQAGAMSLNGAGRLVSLEGSPALADLSRRNLVGLGLAERVSIELGRFSDTLQPTLQKEGPFDFVFIDGHHDEVATLEYFEQIHPFMKPQGLIVFDDVDWSDGMKRAWQKLARDPRFAVSVDLGRIGVCLLGAGAATTDVKLRVR